MVIRNEESSYLFNVLRLSIKMGLIKAQEIISLTVRKQP